MAEPQFDPSKPFTAAPTAFDPSKPFTAAEIQPDFRATNEPPSTALKAAAYGKDALQLALDALPGAGMVVGGALATSADVATGPGGTLAGAALGAGAGRGLRDLIAAGLGLQKPSTALQEGGTMAMDAAETYVAGKVLPALWEAIKAPRATVGDVFDSTRALYSALPKALKAFLPDFEALAKLPKGVAKAPAAILERPAWQSWQDHLPEAQPSPQVARSTSTSMIPAEMPRPVAPVPSAVAVPSPAAPVAQPAAAAPAPVASEPVPAPAVIRMGPDGLLVGGEPGPMIDKARNEAALAARRAAYQASLQPNADAVVKASGKLKLRAPEWKAFQELRARGLSLEDAAKGAKAAGEFARRAGVLSDTEVQAAIDARNMRGQIKEPSAETAAARRRQ